MNELTTATSETPPGPGTAVLAGVIAGAAALGVGELVGGVRSSWQSPVVAVATVIIDRVPRPVKDFGIRNFGSNDKRALIIGILIASVLFAALLGLLARRRPAVAMAGFGAFALVGVWGSQQAVGSDITGVLPSIVAGAAGIGALMLLLPRAASPVGHSLPAAEADAPAAPAGRTRRSFILTTTSVAAVALAAAAGGRALRSRFSAAGSRRNVALPTPATTLPEASDAVTAHVPGVSPFYTPNASFYRVDTAVEVPQLLAENWELRIHGMVDREVRISFADLLQRQFVEEDITLTCVSNTVGGDLLGTARWLGVPLRELLDEAGVQPSADQLVGRSSDGWTSGFPLAALDGRPALLAVGMNGEPLPLEHGFPARVIVSGLYGYVSATKWITELEVSRFDAYDAYWVQRGWSDRGPIKTQSRIDTPRTLASVPAGTVNIGGVAWAQTVGISRVEVQIDDAAFVDATLADELSVNTWRQWSYAWHDATAGRHRITVRATDANGVVQTTERADPFPNGASGWMSILVNVRAGV